jgi:hypothetical protein
MRQKQTVGIYWYMYALYTWLYASLSVTVDDLVFLT